MRSAYDGYCKEERDPATTSGLYRFPGERVLPLGSIEPGKEKRRTRTVIANHEPLSEALPRESVGIEICATANKCWPFRRIAVREGRAYLCRGSG